MSDHFFLDIRSLADMIRRKQLSPVELTQQVLDRVDKLQPKLNAFIAVTRDAALKQAQRSEDEIMRGEWRGPLHGVPIAVKDIIQTKGITTTAGSKMLAGWVPDEDADCVARLYDAGAVLIGKANLHEFAMGATSENPHYGSVRNPWNGDLIAGGSSGGSAVAVAAGLSFGALGTDTAGSIRLPSALCGTVGLKPTYGRVSRHGCLPFSWSLDHIGPMARSVADAALLLEAIAGHDPKDPSSSQAPVRIDSGVRLDHLRGWKLGVCHDYFFEDVHPEIGELVQAALKRLGELGAEIVEVRIPGLLDAQWALKIIAQAEGYSFHEPLLKHFSGMYGEDVRYRLSFGSRVTANEYLKAQKIRNQFVQRALEALKQIDLLISPMNHNLPFPIGSRTPEQAINNMFHLAKAPLGNLLGFPALSLPCGWIGEQMPVGLQFIGKPFQENRLIQAGSVYEESEPWLNKLIKKGRYL